MNHTGPQRRRSRRPSRARRLLIAAASALLVVAVLELALAAAGVEPLARRADPFVGFTPRPLFVPDGEGRLVTAPDKRRLFNEQSFAAHKPPGTRRVFCLGGSTTHGRPYDDRGSFCAWLRALLPAVDGAHAYEVVNAGGISYASYRIAALAEELAAHEPDLFVVYTGHNEFLERRTYADVLATPDWLLALSGALASLRSFSLAHALVRPDGALPGVGERERLPDEVAPVLDRTFGPDDYERDDAFARVVVEHFRRNLRRLVAIARGAGAEVVLVTPAASLRDCAPFKSVPDGGLGEQERARLEALVEQGAAARREGRLGEAIEALEAARALSPRHARAAYELGEALYAAGDHERAGAALQRALEEDVCPLRARAAIVGTVRELARELDVALVDLEAGLRAADPARAPGAESFLDHVHPTLEVHRTLAERILETLAAEGLVRPTREPGPTERARIDAAVRGRIDETAHGVALRNLAKVLSWAGKGEEAERLAARADAVLGADAESRFVMGLVADQAGDPAAAEAHYRAALAIDEGYLEAATNLAELLLRRGRVEDALAPLARARALAPDDARLAATEGLALARTGDPERGVAVLEAAIATAPDDPVAHNNLGIASLAAGRARAAMTAFEEALRLDPGYVKARYNRALLLLELGRTDEARRELDRVLEDDPDHDGARRRRAALDA